MGWPACRRSIPSKVDVPPDRQFTDFDGYKKAIALADVVILATSPGFRPMHFEEAVRQGKHVFMEKPVATDAPGIRQLLAAAEEAKKKNLKVGVGFQRRHQRSYLEIVKRLHDGAVGDIQMLRVYWDGGSRDGVERLPNETEMHYQIRNWYYFTWLSGDHIVEQHCHNIDVGNWIKGAHPVRAQGMGGRQVRNAKRHGQIFDHHFVEFEYADGVADVQPMPPDSRLLADGFGARPGHQRHGRFAWPRLRHQGSQPLAVRHEAEAERRLPAGARRPVQRHPE